MDFDAEKTINTIIQESLKDEVVTEETIGEKITNVGKNIGEEAIKVGKDIGNKGQTAVKYVGNAIKEHPGKASAIAATAVAAGLGALALAKKLRGAKKQKTSVVKTKA